MAAIERQDQPTITIVNTPPTERSVLNGKKSINVFAGFQTPALGPAVINSVLLAEGYEDTTTLDPNFNEKSSRFKISEAKFTESDFNRLANSDFVLVSSMTRNREVSLRLIEWVKSNNPNAVIIVGGPDATFKPELWLKGEKGADYVVRNEGEKTIVELMQALMTGSSVENIKGISYKKDGVIINNEQRPLMTEQELSDVPLPFFPENIIKNRGANVVETKRGCPNKCDFCSVTALYGGTYRLKDNRTVLNSIRAGDRKKATFFVDDNFAHKSRLEEAKDGMRAIINYGLNDRKYYMQLDTVTVNTDPEFAKLASKMGTFAVFLGIESVDQDVLRGMHKAATADQNMSAIQKFQDELIFVHGMEIMGSKNETRKSIDGLKSWNRLSGINSIQIFPEIPIVGSKLADRKYLLPRAKIDTNLIDGQNVIAVPECGFTCSELQEEIGRAYRDFYSLRNLPNAFNPLRHFFENPNKSLDLTKMNLGVRLYAKNLLSQMAKSEYTKDYKTYLNQVDSQVHIVGKDIFNAANQH